MESNQNKPKNYLSMDGGADWLSALPALLTLEEIFERLKWDLKLRESPLVCKVFDMIVATGPAALAALMVGKLSLTPSQAIDACLKLESALSVGLAKDDAERARNSEAFRNAFTEVLVDAGFDENTPMQSEEQDESDAKIAVCTVSATNLSVLHPLRSYPVRGSPAPRYTILDVACASIASPDKFLPVTIGSGHRKLVLIDAMVGYANPTKELLQEAQRVYGEDAEVSTIFSLGYGKGEILSVSGTSDDDALVNALKRMALDCEQTHKELHGRLYQTSIYFRFNVERGLEGHRDVSVVCERTTAYLKDGAIDKQLDEAVKGIRGREKGSTLKEINSVAVTEITIKPRPSVVESFVGREDILEALRTTHLGSRSSDARKPAVSVLTGLGGSGKTQTALKFALEYESVYPDESVYFFDGSSEDKLKADFAVAIRARGTAYCSQSHEDSLVWFANRKDDWLIIIDNTDDPSVKLFRFIPKSSRGNVIITTRNATYKTLAPNGSHHIEGLSPSEAIALILTGSSYAENEVNRSYAQGIAKELGYLPLALAHAAAYISIHRCLPTYLAMYQRSRIKFLASNQALPEDYSLSVATTIQMSLDSDSITPAARDVMALFARFDASMIAHSIIAISAERRFYEISDQSEDETVNPQTTQHANILMGIFCPSGEWLESEFNNIIQQCMQYSLLQVATQGEDRFYFMHILVQSYLQSHSDNIRSHQPERLVIRLLGSAIRSDDNYKYQLFNRSLAPHLRAVAVENVIEAGDHAGFGQVLYEQGSLQLSVAHLERCLELRKRVLGDEHVDTADAMGNIASCYNQLGKYQEAMDLAEKVLELRTRVLGDKHPKTLLAMNNLASSYSALGRYQEALNLAGKVLELQSQISGDEHPSTLRAMANLAACYSHLGRYQKALDIEEKVFELQRRVLGDAHPGILHAMGNIAESYSALGRYQEAADLREKVLELRTRISGDEHPSTLREMANLATSYRKMKRYQEALDLEEKVLELQTRDLGDEHPDTLVTMGNLAATYSSLGRNQEALDLTEKVFALRKKISGDEHPFTLVAMANLATFYRKMERYQEALDLEEKVLTLRKQVSGEDHPYTLVAMNNLALTLFTLGMKDRAITLVQAAVPLHEKSLGVDHPSTLMAKRFLQMLQQ